MAGQSDEPPEQDTQGANCCFTAAATFGMVASLAVIASGLLVRRLR